MPNFQVAGGPAIPISEQSSSNKVVGGPAVPVYIIQSGDGYRVDGGPAVPVKVITDPSYPRVGGPVLPVSIITSGSRNVSALPAMPVYYVNPPATVIVNPNLIVNGDFSTNTNGWTASHATLASVAGGQTGNCLRITNTDNVGCAYQQMTNTAGNYRVRFYGKNGSAAGRVVLSANFYDWTGVWAKDIATGGIFSATDEIISLPANAYLNLFVGSAAPGDTSYFDEIIITSA